MTTRPLTCVTQLYLENQCNYRCVFGPTTYSIIVDNTFGRTIEQAWFVVSFIHVAHPCAPPFGQLRCTKPQSCHFVMTGFHIGRITLATRHSAA